MYCCSTSLDCQVRMPSYGLHRQGVKFRRKKTETEPWQNILKIECAGSFQAGAAYLQMKWNLIQTRFGGLWKTSIKNSKYHLRRVMGNHVLTFSELTSLFLLNRMGLQLKTNRRRVRKSKVPQRFNTGSSLLWWHLCCGGVGFSFARTSKIKNEYENSQIGDLVYLPMIMLLLSMAPRLINVCI